MTLSGSGVPISQLTSPSALRLLRNLLTLPALAYVPIHPESFNTKRTSEVSTQLIISQQFGGKEFVTDNSAPGPRIWNLRGYLCGIPYVELTNWFMPSLQAQKLVIDLAHTSRKPTLFRTTDGEIVVVLIKECNFIEEPDNMNTVKIEVVLQEMNYLTISNTVSPGSTPKGLSASLPTIGSSLGKAIAIGSVTAVLGLTRGIDLLANVFAMAKAAAAEKEAEKEAAIAADLAEAVAKVESLLTASQVTSAKSINIYNMRDIFPYYYRESFEFNTVINDISYKLTFRYDRVSEWCLTVVTTETKYYTIRYNILLGSGNADFSIMFLADNDDPPIGYLRESKLVIIQW